MDFQGRVIQYIGETTGVNKAGKPWKKKEWVVETYGQFARKVKLQCFNERSDSLNLQLGKDYTLYVDLESREFNGKWYTDVSVYRADENNQAPVQQPGGFQNTGAQSADFNNMPYGNQPGNFGGQPFNSQPLEDNSDEDLPF